LCSALANRKELVTDFLRKAKQLEYLIDSLPSPPSEEALRTEQDLAELEAEVQEANKEYLSALGEAGERPYPPFACRAPD